jgi:hypothetical protein
MTHQKRSARYRLLRSWALRSREIQRGLRRAEQLVEAWTGSVLRRALRDREKESLSIELYEASFDPRNDREGLYPWETQWFERRLPSPPASILVGAAGAGREAVALQSLGYRVHAFEPSGSPFRLCRRRLGSELVDQASYQDLIATVLREERTALRLSSSSRFDAVLLGWGSFGHVLRRADRSDLLRACDQIAPNGPILFSLFEPKTESASDDTYYTPWGGFLIRPTVVELETHAKALNRELVVSVRGRSPYATLLANPLS